MKYLFGFDCDFEEKCEKIGTELDDISTQDERAAELMRMFNFDENTKPEELTILDIIPGVAELMLDIPHEFWTKPICQLTEEDEKLYDDAVNKVMTVFTSNK